MSRHPRPGAGDRGGGGGRGRRAAPDQVVIWGLHAVAAALANPERGIIGLRVSENAALRLAPQIAARGLSPRIEPPRGLGAGLPEGAVHQGAVLTAAPLPARGLADAVPGRPLIALDQVTDPRNVGAILRVAAAFAAGGVIVTRRHGPQESGVIAKAASGGLELVPLIEVANLARALGEARALGYWAVGLDSDAPHGLGADALHGVVLFVLGAEGAGLRRLTRERCDLVARLDLPGEIRSLNVAAACALALHVAGAHRLTG
jgi:23S rRNA (guanosine2251-2'-O)-methyltransferase